MACNLITNRARSLRSLMDKGIIDENQQVLKEADFNTTNVEVTQDMENIIGTKLPNDVFAFGTNVNFVTPNQELFYRADAAEGIIYPENKQFQNNYSYPIQENKGDNLNTKLTDLLSNIGVSVTSLTTDHKFKDIKGVADTFNKVAYAALNPTEVSTLPEEGAHMFVEFIEQNEPRLFNKMMTDIPKYGIYKEVKEEYLPIYNDLNKVKKEAIGKAIAEYLVGNKIDPNVGSLRAWFNEVLKSLRKALATFGILNESDYNNYFEYTADKILKGDFVGEFQGTGEYFNIDTEENENDTIEQKRLKESIKLLNLRDQQLKLLPVIKNGVETEAYFYNGKQVKYRVTEKIRDKSSPVKESTPDQLLALEYGKRGHKDLDNLWKIKTGRLEANTVVPQTSTEVFAKLANFVDVVYDQFPGAEIRTEVKIYDPKTDTAGTIDVVIIEEDGTVNVLDNKFMAGKYTKIPENYEKQLGEYKRILRNSYGFQKFGQMRVIPFQTKYSGKLENKVITDIDLGSNNYIEDPQRSHLNPLPASFELTKEETLNRALQGLNEQLAKLQEVSPSNEAEQVFKDSKINNIKETIAKLQITNDITSLEATADVDRQRMEYILRKQNPTPDELWELKELRDYYHDFITKKYNIDPDGNENETLTLIAKFAQESTEVIDQKLEVLFNEHEIDTSKINKPISKWSRLKQLSDFDNPVFQALQRILNKGNAQNEMKIKKSYQEIKDIINQIFKETGKTGTEAYSDILKKKDGKPTNKLISRVKSEWYEMHTSLYNDSSLKGKLNKYFDSEAYNKFYQELEQDYIQRHRGLEGKFDAQGNDKLQIGIKRFKANIEKSRGLGNPSSKFYNIPDEFLTDEYLKVVKNKPDSGLAKLYNKYIEINEFANKNADANIPLGLLPYIKKSTIEMLANDNFNARNLGNNVLDKLKLYEWESFDIDANGQKVYKIPLRYKGTKFQMNEDQSFDLGEMLQIWTESVYQNAHLQEINTTTKLFQVALKKSKEVIYKNGKPLLENGELRTTRASDETLEQFQEYLNMYLFGVTDEDGDYDILGYSRNKIVKTAMQYLSGKAIGLNVFSGFANIMGGLSQATAIAAKGNQFTIKQLGKSITNLADPKMRALISLMDVTNNQFKKDKAINLSASKAESFVTWDKLYILQQGGDWLIQNGVLGAMSQNYTIKEGKIIKKTEGEKSVLELTNIDKDGKIVIEGLDLNKEEDYLTLFKFREKVRRVSAEVNGNTSEYDKFLAGNTLKGQLLLQFRRWILPMATSRFGDLTYNQNLEEFQIGKYRSLAKTLLNRKTIDAAKQLLLEQNSSKLESIVFEQYQDAKLLNPDITYEEFKKLYIQNLHSVFAEVAILGLFSALLFGFNDDDDKDLFDKIISRGLLRSSSEMSFWYSSDSFLSIIRTPIPLIGLVTDTLNFLGAGTSSAYDAVFEADEDIDFGEKFTKMIPGVNALNRMLDDLEKD